MTNSIQSAIIAEETIVSKIYQIRGKKVMLDRDLADLYGVETRTLNQAVRRNEKRFPDDFMFQLTINELENWKSQFVISNSNKEKMGLRKLPLAFTEQGVAQLSSVLNSETAIEVNIQIIRTFTKMRELLLAHKDILIKLEKMEKKMIKQGGKLQKHDQDIHLIFESLKQLLNPPQEPRPRIGFRRKGEHD
ncbi:MAG: ORF6N domain-containing protein [Bacteroidetes bacterium]|nr:ORF6N domain-containing protein [Bacteroidota bacterium]